MWRLTIILFVIMAPTIMGVLILAAMMVPSLQSEPGRWIVIDTASGDFVSIPISFAVAKANSGKPASGRLAHGGSTVGANRVREIVGSGSARWRYSWSGCVNQGSRVGGAWAYGCRSR